MNANEILSVKDGEKPLDNLVSGGGFASIFRTIAVVGDSLSSGEFESQKDGVKGYHDYFEYSWGQYMARDLGSTVYNFSRGGMTAGEYCNGFADAMNFWNPKYFAQAYIIALGVNDVSRLLSGSMYAEGFGSMSDVDFDDPDNNKNSFVGYYCRIIQKLRKISPDSKIFVMTIPRDSEIVANPARDEYNEKHAEFLRSLDKYFKNVYVLDFRAYAPDYDKEFEKKYYMGGHLNAMGYVLTARMVESYIDYIIRANYEDFKQVPFIGTAFSNELAKPL